MLLPTSLASELRGARPFDPFDPFDKLRAGRLRAGLPETQRHREKPEFHLFRMRKRHKDRPPTL